MPATAHKSFVNLEKTSTLSNNYVIYLHLIIKNNNKSVFIDVSDECEMQTAVLAPDLTQFDAKLLFKRHLRLFTFNQWIVWISGNVYLFFVFCLLFRLLSGNEINVHRNTAGNSMVAKVCMCVILR